MNKKLLILSIVGIALVSVPSAHAANSTSNTATFSCVQEAVSEREAALQEGWVAFSGKIDDAYLERSEALDEAYGSSDVATLKTAIKNAWKSFKNAVKEARADWKEVRKDAWATFKTDKKACRAPAAADDTTNQSAEVQ